MHSLKFVQGKLRGMFTIVNSKHPKYLNIILPMIQHYERNLRENLIGATVITGSAKGEHVPTIQVELLLVKFKCLKIFPNR